jgi:hypothetical protein
MRIARAPSSAAIMKSSNIKRYRHLGYENAIERSNFDTILIMVGLSMHMTVRVGCEWRNALYMQR